MGEDASDLELGGGFHRVLQIKILPQLKNKYNIPSCWHLDIVR